MVVPVYNQLLDHVQDKLDSMEEEDDMHDAIEACFKKLENYYNISSEICTAATILDPRYKTSPYEDDDNPDSIDVKRITDQVELEFKTLYFMENNIAANNAPSPNTSLFFKKKRRKNCETATEEFRRYLSAPDCDLDCNPLEWWKVNASSFPNLSRMARYYLAVPGTEASAEREFAGGRLLITAERGSLGPKTIRAIQCLKSWLK